MKIRKAKYSDLSLILKVYEKAREYMRNSGNPNQWGNNKPSVELLEEDIKKGELFVGENEGEINFVFAFILGEDPTYSYIEDGNWLSDAPYGTIHRIASDGTVKGVVKMAVDYCKNTISNLRIDTHEDNKTMQHVLSKLGFSRCGIIYLEDGNPRIAYQRLCDVTRLVLIRHGESEANNQGYFAGQYDAKLMPKGMEQAVKTAEYIVKKYAPDEIYSSDLVRAYSTAMPVSRLIGKEIKSHKGLREIFAGEWQKMPFDDLQKDFSEEYGVWLKDIGNARCSGGESVKELGDRVMATLTEIAKENPGKTIAVATHATPIRVSQTIIKYGDIVSMKNVPWIPNASVTVYEYDGSWKCISEVEDEHLGDDKTVFPANV